MSFCNFYRAFEGATGQPGDQIALGVGFGSADRLRRVFARRLGVSPARHRERFTRSCAHDAAMNIPLIAGTRGR